MTVSETADKFRRYAQSALNAAQAEMAIKLLLEGDADTPARRIMEL